MDFLLHLSIFIFAAYILYLASELVVRGLSRVAKFLGWKEFVVAFFIMAFAGSLPNLFVGITAALRGIPELSFGDVSGNNIVALTLAVALAIFFTKDKSISTKSRTTQGTSIFTAIAVILPLLLILDGELSRTDGLILIGLFIFYNFWLFSKKERFTRVYEKDETEETMRSLAIKSKRFFRDIISVTVGIILLIVAANWMVNSAVFFAEFLEIPVVFIGLLILGLGNALPEIYFSIASARKGETWMILGNLMGSVIVLSTLVLGTVSLINPIQIPDFSPFAVARIFLIISVMLFVIFARTGKKISAWEALALLGIYLMFVITEMSLL